MTRWRRSLAADPLVRQAAANELKPRTWPVDPGEIVLGGFRPSDSHYRPAGRALEVSVGLVCAACGSGLALLGAFPFYAVLRRGRPFPEGPVLLPVLLFWALAALLLVFAWRLILNRTRRWDGGLLSPLGLRIGGVIFLAGPIVALVAEPLHLLHTSFALAAAAASFALARHRERYLSGDLPPDAAA